MCGVNWVVTASYVNKAWQAVEENNIDAEILALWSALESLGYKYPNEEPEVVFS